MTATAAQPADARPLIFSGESVRAIIEGRKTQSRRVLTASRYMRAYAKGKWGGFDSPAQEQEAARMAAAALMVNHEFSGTPHPCPYGGPGDLLWVKEAWHKQHGKAPIIYAADRPDCKAPKTSPLFLPRRLSRITLELTAVRVERATDLTVYDLLREGVEWEPSGAYPPDGRAMDYLATREAWKRTWDAINAKRGYPLSAAPWVWVLSFRRLEGQP